VSIALIVQDIFGLPGVFALRHIAPKLAGIITAASTFLPLSVSNILDSSIVRDTHGCELGESKYHW
jgi:hypothetical protein